MKNIIAVFLVITIIGAGAYIFIKKPFQNKKVLLPASETENNIQNLNNTDSSTGATTAIIDTSKTIIGTSVEGNSLTAYHFGEGKKEILFVGGIHGGYEWNTSLVAFELMDYLAKNPTNIPKNVKVTVIPVVNPDGLKKVVGTTGIFTQKDVSQSKDVVISGRFNANTVDLNRNFDCDWNTNATWQSKKVSGGTSVFSEPESQAIKQYVETNNLTAVVVWYSAAGGVFASNCHNGVSSETKAITKVFADASGYKAYESFNFYETTGDMVNWLAKKKIPAISVLLTNHTDTEWNKNEAGIKALLTYYAQ